jgi:hypothetical protein
MVDELLEQIASRTHGFLLCLQREDAAAATTYYGATATYADPVVGELTGRELRSFWPFVFSQITHHCLEYQVVDVGLCSARIEQQVSFRVGHKGDRVDLRVSSYLRFRGPHVVCHENEFDSIGWCRRIYPERSIISFLRRGRRRAVLGNLRQSMTSKTVEAIGSHNDNDH